MWHKVTVNTRRLGEPVLTTAAVDASGLELAARGIKTRTHQYKASMGFFYRKTLPSLTLN